MRRETLSSLEGLRLLSSVAIVASHFIPYATHAVDTNGLAIFVDLFFVISGIVIASAYGNRVGTRAEYGLFVQRRLARLYPLHLATMLAYMGIAAAHMAGLLSVSNPARYDVNALPSYLTLTQSWFTDGVIAWNGVTWSISAEFFVYLIFPLIWWLLHRRMGVALAIVALLAMSCAIGSELIADRPFTRLITQVAQLRALPSFAFGVALAAHADGFARRLSGLAAPAMLAAGTLLTVITLTTAPNGYLSLAGVWLIAAGAYGADLRGLATPLGWKPISDMGKLTYSIYLIHPLVATIFLAFVGKRLFGGLPGGAWISVAIGAVLVGVLSWLSYTYFEEPLRRWLGRPLLRVRDPEPGAAH